MSEIEDFSKDVMNDEVEINIPTPLGPIIVKFKKLGNAKWVAVIGSIAVALVAVYLAIPSSASGPLAVPVDALLASTATVSATSAIAIIGLSATIVAIKLCYFSGTKNTEVLKRIRNNYDVVKKDGVFKLVRKKNIG
jgi:hypothetical protein